MPRKILFRPAAFYVILASLGYAPLAKGATACSFSGVTGNGFNQFSGSPNTFFVLPSGGSGGLTITFFGTGCTWSVSTGQPWITFSGATSGTNPGQSVSVGINVAPNSGPSELVGSISVFVNGSSAAAW